MTAGYNGQPGRGNGEAICVMIKRYLRGVDKRAVLGGLMLLALLATAVPKVLANEPNAQSSGVLSIKPESGPAGTSFSVGGDGAQSGATVDVQWTTWDGSYVSSTSSATVAYQKRSFAEKRVSLGQLTADATGHFEGTFAAPEDFGQLHELHAVINGQDEARGGFQE